MVIRRRVGAASRCAGVSHQAPTREAAARGARREGRRLAERFGAADETETLATPDVLERGEPVRLVYHDPDGGWWFSSERGDDEMVIACLACILQRHPELVDVANLPVNWIAHRDDGYSWVLESRPDEWGAWEEDGEGD